MAKSPSKKPNKPVDGAPGAQRNKSAKNAIPTDEGFARVLISSEAIQARVSELADEIERDYEGGTLCMVALLTGAFVFAADLVRRLPLRLSIEFIRISSYSGTQSTGVVVVSDAVTDTVAGRDVLIVDDILDTGLTMATIRDQLLAAGAKSVHACVLLSKAVKRKADVTADYCGFEIEDEFVVGYGLDYNGRYRNLPDIAVLSVRDE